jgi:hypothetical protein
VSAYDDLVTSIRFWEQIQGDAKRTVICEPHRVDEIRAAVDERGCGGTVTVRASTACPEGQLVVIDEAAMEAADRQMVQRAGRDIRFR